MHTITHLSEVIATLPPRPTIVLHTGFAEPVTLAAQLAECAPQLDGATVYVFMPMGDAPYATEAATRYLNIHAFFPGKALRQPIAQGRVTPNRTRFSQVPGLFERGEIRADLLLLQLSEPDDTGRFSMGLSVDYMPAVLAQNPTVVAEINSLMPRTLGQTWVGAERIHHAIHVTMPPHTAERAQGDDLERQIAGHVAGLVQSGDVLQLGIGALPDMVLEQLGHLSNLGLHSGIITDAVRPLVESGVINNATKRQHAGLCVTTMAAGSPEFYRYLHANPAFAFHPCSHTHAAATLSAIEGLCCINSVLQVDLNGNANAETVGGRLISTPGGLLDFAQGACLAPRGKSIIALRSANRDATVSSIVTALESAAPRSLQATDIDYIVTEYGVARVRGESPESLRRNLRAIAHPHFRDTL